MAVLRSQFQKVFKLNWFCFSPDAICNGSYGEKAMVCENVTISSRLPNLYDRSIVSNLPEQVFENTRICTISCLRQD